MANSKQEIENVKVSWRNKMYLYGTLLGTLTGFVISYLYARSAAEGALIDQTGKPRPIKTGELLSLTIAGVALIRQITELGREQK
jgi:hypothetical protein